VEQLSKYSEYTAAMSMLLIPVKIHPVHSIGLAKISNGFGQVEKAA